MAEFIIVQSGKDRQSVQVDCLGCKKVIFITCGGTPLSHDVVIKSKCGKSQGVAKPPCCTPREGTKRKEEETVEPAVKKEVKEEEENSSTEVDEETHSHVEPEPVTEQPEVSHQIESLDLPSSSKRLDSSQINNSGHVTTDPVVHTALKSKSIHRKSKQLSQTLALGRSKISSTSNLEKRYCIRSVSKGEDLKRIFSCRLCGLSFKKKCDLCKHKGECREKQRKMVKKEPRSFKVKEPKIGVFHCCLCAKVLKYQCTLRAHLQKHLTEPKSKVPKEKPPAVKKKATEKAGVYTCEVCGKQFAKRSVLYCHRSVHGPKKHICEVCGKGFTSKGLLRIHTQYTHEKQRPFKCDLCDKAYESNFKLHIHRLSHFGKKHYMCDICGKELASLSNLSRHKETHGENRRFSCHVCGRRFWQKNHLNEHLWIHSGERSFICEHCGKKFFTKAQQKSHTDRVHLGIKRSQSRAAMEGRKNAKTFPCGECLKVFHCKAQLVQHQMTHTGEKPFPCDVCEKHFRNRSMLAIHKRTHTLEKPYTCSVCDRKFSSQSNWRRHELVHQGYRPYKCEYCGKTFGQKQGMQAHVKTHEKRLALTVPSAKPPVTSPPNFSESEQNYIPVPLHQTNQNHVAETSRNCPEMNHHASMLLAGSSQMFF